jgi:hypothetical protein
VTIKSKPATKEYREGHDRIFGRKKADPATRKAKEEFDASRVIKGL